MSLVDMVRIARAFLSVFDKAGIVELARELETYDIELVSTGGTHSALVKAGLYVREVSELTNFPEMMDGRVKTLHPVIHGGLLAVRGNPDHQLAMQKHGIAPIDLLVVNLYPFEETVRKGGTLEECVEKIDVGGPAMIRAAAKNYDYVAAVTDPSQYPKLLEELAAHEGSTSLKFRQRMMVEAFAATALYDGAVQEYFGKKFFPGTQFIPD